MASPQYRTIINYYSTLYNFDYVVEGYDVITDGLDPTKYRKAYQKNIDSVEK